MNEDISTIEMIFGLFVFAVVFLFGMTIGGDCSSPTTQEKEIIDKVCHHIYENETIEVYKQYCE